MGDACAHTWADCEEKHFIKIPQKRLNNVSTIAFFSLVVSKMFSPLVYNHVPPHGNN